MLDANDEGSADGLQPLDESSLLLALTQGQNSAEDLLDQNDFLGNQVISGYASSPYVPFRVQVKARDSIPNSEFGNVPNSDVRKADDPTGDAGFLTPGQKSGSTEGTIVAGAIVPIPADAQSVGQDETTESGTKGDVTGAEPDLIASTIDLGLQEQDTPSEYDVNSNLVDNGPILGNGDINPTLALAFADVASASGKSGVQLTDPFFANPNSASLDFGFGPGSTFSSAAVGADNFFTDPVSDFVLPPVRGASTQASLFSPDGSATGSDNDGSSSSSDQNQSFLRTPPEQIDWNDPCNLIHGSDTPFSECTLSTSRGVPAPFRIPTVPRPDSDIAVDSDVG